MIKKVVLFFVFSSVIFNSFSQNYTLTSPNTQLKLTMNIADELVWSVQFKGQTIIEKAAIGMSFSTQGTFGKNAKVKKHNQKFVSEIINVAVSHKDAIIKDEYNVLILSFKGDYQLELRAYDEGVAYRFIDTNKGSSQVVSEKMNLEFPKESRSLFPQEVSMYSHNERKYLDKALVEIGNEEFCSLPVLFSTPKAKVLFTETDLTDYPGMFLKGNGSNEISTKFPNYVLEAIPSERGPDRNQTITKTANYIAQKNTKRSYPWRLFIISDDDRTFVESNLSYQLAAPSMIQDTDWIQPGKVAWDWYNANNISGVDFVSGLNTATYKYYIDFAAANNISYVILDEGWTKSTTEILQFNPNMDVPELIRYGKEKGVELILWVLWKPLDEDMAKILETYKSWGVKGIKVDFMQRNDQYMVNSYERIAKECARLQLLVDFHGAFKPSGLRRKYPNVLNYEGVKGSENNKWSSEITPEHNVTIPFIRMAAGPMDYTPGAMINKQLKNYAISFERPMSLGTRAHQVAMYVVYEAPLQMLCESPSVYYKEQETVNFITKIPTTWDETRVLKGEVTKYIAVARRKGTQWFIGAMTNWDTRDFSLDLSFLSDGAYTIEIFQDGVNANRFAQDYKITSKTVTKSSKITAKLASGGGWSAIITKN